MLTIKLKPIFVPSVGSHTPKMSHLFLVIAGEPLIGETPEDFQDLEGCFMTQAIVASYNCCGRGHGGILDPTIIKVKIPQSHLESVQKNEDPNLFRSEKLHICCSAVFHYGTVASLPFSAVNIAGGFHHLRTFSTQNLGT